MTSPAPLLQRLNTHRANTRRMLTPGLKGPAQQPRSLSPVLAGLQSNKHPKIGQKMRALSPQGLGSLNPQSIALTSRKISEKFENPASLLHIRTPASADTSIWSEIEQTLPSDEAASASQAALDPGILRHGTPIQRMPAVPKPGPTIDTGKEKLKPRATAPKIQKTVAQPVRRYSRVEEITKPGTPFDLESTAPQTDAPTLQAQPDPRADTFEDTQARPAQPPAPISQPDQASRKPQTPELPAPVSQPEQPSREKAPESPAPIHQAAKPPETETPPAKSPPPDERKPLLLARPTARKSAAAQTKPSLQKARPTRPQAAAHSQPGAKTTQNLVQRQVERPSSTTGKKPAPAPPSGPDQPKPPAPPISQQAAPDAPPQTRLPVEAPLAPKTGDQDIPPARPRTDRDSPSQPPSTKSPEAQPAPQPVEAPLLTHLDIRRAAPQQVRFLEPKISKTDGTPPRPLITRPSLPSMLRPQEKSSTPALPSTSPQGETMSLPSPTSAMTPQQGLDKLDQRGFDRLNLATQGRLLPLPASADSPLNEMPVARPYASPRELRPSSFKPGGAQSLSPFQPPRAQTTTPAQASAPAVQSGAMPEAQSIAPVPDAPENIVQRLWEEHSPPSESGSSGEGGTSSASSETGTDFDLDKLAEDVLPIVKRLIEIETERSSGYLR